MMHVLMRNRASFVEVMKLPLLKLSLSSPEPSEPTVEDAPEQVDGRPRARIPRFMSEAQDSRTGADISQLIEKRRRKRGW